MKNYLWSPSKNAFIPAGMVEDYRNAGWDIDELMPVEDDIFAEYSAEPPDGKVRGMSADNLPEWVNLPPPSREEQIAIAERQRQSLLAEANAITADWRTELALNIIDDDDKAKLAAWMKYIKAVKAVDTSTASDVSWPEKPV